MRQLWIQVPKGQGEKAVDIARSCKGINLAQIDATSRDESIDLVLIHVSNSQLESLLEELEPIPDAHINWIPEGVVTLRPPPSEAPKQVVDVQLRSPIEVFLAGLQSIGSWWGFLSYAAIAGIVVWVGLYTNTSFLLTASMLIAPFAGPAMNVAIATARGDVMLLWRSLLRYFSALAVCIATSALLSVVLQQQIATQLMIATGHISSVSVLLPVAAGAAGAIFLVQSQRSSLVSGAAVGVLVAASLAPPTGLTGMAIALRNPDLVRSGLFLLMLQLAGINLSASLVFRWCGLSVKGARYSRGKQMLLPIALGVTVLIIVGLLSWQFSNPPFLQRSSRAQRINAEVQEIVKQSEAVQLIEATTRFPNADVSGQPPLLITVAAQKQAGVALSDETLQTQLSETIREELRAADDTITPLIDITIFQPPEP